MTPAGFGLGLMAALVYGTADLAGGVASRRSSAITILVGAYLVSLPIVLVGASAEGGPLITPMQAGWAAVGGIAEVVATLALYLALAAGTMSLISPLVGVVGAAIPLAFGLATGERLPPSQAIGMALAFGAIVVVAGPRVGPHQPRRVLLLALTAGLAYAASFVAFSASQESSAGAGPWQVALLARSVGLGAVLIVARARALPLVPPRGARPYVALAGVLDATALSCLLGAYGAGPLGLTTVVASLYPAVTVVLAGALLRERLGRTERCGVVLALGAVVLMGLS
jgi:drug/metabolite transporter (DMT)-like permease